MKTKFEMTSLVGLLLVCGVATGSTQPGNVAGVLALEDAIERAVRDNPNLAEMQARYQALASIPSQVATRPDPVLSVNALNFPTDTFDFDQEPMTQLQLGVTQVFPFPGKLSLRAAASEFEAEAALNDFAETRLGLIRDVRSSWWSVYYLDRALVTLQRSQELMRQFVQIAKSKYEVGDGIQQDVLLAQLELSRMLDQSIQLTGVRRTEAARLNRLLGRPGARVELPGAVRRELPELASVEVLVGRAQEIRPRLQQKRNQINAAQSRLALARKDYFPDFTLGAAYGARGGDNPMPRGGARPDFLSLRLSVNLPIYQTRKRAQAVSQRSSELERQRYALQDEVNAMHEEIAQAVADYDKAREQLSLLETGIVPQARQTVESMLAGYQVSEVDFLNLVRSQVTLYNYEMLSWRALSMANQALARLRAAVGEEHLGE